MKSIIEELTSYRVKVEKDGKEIMNAPSIIALPVALIAPRASIIGTVAASLLGCKVHLENEDGKTVDIGKAVKDAADTVVDVASTAAKTVKEEMDKAWDALSADDPEGCPVGEENEPETSTPGEESKEETEEEVVEELEKHEADDVPTIKVENPNKPE